MTYDDYLKAAPGPAYLVMDLYRPLLNAYAALEKMVDFECDISEAMIEVVNVLGRRDPIGTGRLEGYLGCVTNEHDRAGNRQDGVIYSRAMQSIAEEILEQIEGLDLYDKDGFFNYRFWGWVDPFNIVLEKYIETDAFDPV